MHAPSRLIWIAQLWALVLAVMLGLGLGCASKSSSYAGAAPGYYDEYGSDGGGEYYEYEEDAAAYDYEDDLAEGELRNDFKSREMAPAKSKDAAAPMPEPDPEPSETPDLEAPEEPGDGERPEAASKQRQIIYTARMQVSVYGVEQALAKVEALPERFGGWMHQRQDNQIILRVPAERLREVMAAVGELGVVESRSLEALDVTAEYTDLESRIRILIEMQAQLEDLLKKAKSVEQSLEIRRALDAVTMELEQARARMRELAKSIAFSTLIVRIVNRGPEQELPSSNDPFPWVSTLGVEATEYR